MTDLRPSRATPARHRRGHGRRGPARSPATYGRAAQPLSPIDVASPTLFAGQERLQGRRFLIVTAPFGPFGRVLAEVLEARGAEVRRMIFNAADVVDWRRGGGIAFQDEVGAWPGRVRDLALDFTDFVVFGEGGPYNRAVLNQAEDLAANVWVLENGYFRPDWVTVERNGVNASSRLARFREAYAAPAPAVSPTRRAGRILPHHVVHISGYHLIQILGAGLFPRYHNHYTQPAWRQCLGHIRRYIGLAFRPPRQCDHERLAARGPFFIACLQREGDAQLLRYSRYADNTAFLAEVMRSFARSAPEGARLVIKNHPLDPGLVDLPAVTRRLAADFGLMERVDFIDGGNLAQLCRASRGMVVNNSSAALSALGFRTPVKVLGDAFFDFEGLTDQKPLDAFWASPEAPDADLFARFRAHVIAQAQVNGNYHEPRALRPTAQGVADMFERVAD